MTNSIHGGTWSSTFVEPLNVEYKWRSAKLDEVNAGKAVLHVGSTGPSVVRVQEKLNILLAHYTPFDDLLKLAPDGDFGPLTYAAVWWVQEKFGLNLDGLVGPETLGKIDELVAGIGAGKTLNDDVVTRSKTKGNQTKGNPTVDPTDPLAGGGMKSNPVPRGPLGLTGRVGHNAPNRSNDVTAVQRALVKHEYLAADAFEQGVFDDATFKALRAFQVEQTRWRDVRVDINGDTAKRLAGPKVDRLWEIKPIAPTTLVGGVPELPDRLKSFFPNFTPVAVDFEPASGQWDSGARQAWLSAALQEKTFFTHEPRTNACYAPMPPWLDINALMDAYNLRQVGEDGKTTYHALTGVHTGYRNGQPKPGGELTATATTHFIVHETVGLADMEGMRRSNESIKTTMYIGRDDQRERHGGYYLGFDYSKNVLGAKTRARDEPRCQFVSAELSSHVLAQPFTDQQYRDLAIAYVMASHRAGRFVTIVPHREVDRGIRNGHYDPRGFDWDKLYGEINRLTGMPEGTTYGYQTDRDAGDGKKNKLGQVRTFPDIYGPVRTR